LVSDKLAGGDIEGHKTLFKMLYRTYLDKKLLIISWYRRGCLTYWKMQKKFNSRSSFAWNLSPYKCFCRRHGNYWNLHPRLLTLSSLRCETLSDRRSWSQIVFHSDYSRPILMGFQHLSWSTWLLKSASIWATSQVKHHPIRCYSF